MLSGGEKIAGKSRFCAPQARPGTKLQIEAFARRQDKRRDMTFWGEGKIASQNGTFIFVVRILRGLRMNRAFDYSSYLGPRGGRHRSGDFGTRLRAFMLSRTFLGPHRRH